MNVRIEQTEQLWQQLNSEVKQWLDSRRAADKKRAHKTQLNAIDTVLSEALSGVHARINDIQTAAAKCSLGLIYSDCRDCDIAIIWLRRLWQYFVTMFVQRDAEATRGLLLAADEVSWSCYHHAWEHLNSNHSHGPAPLSFVAAEYSPAALPNTEQGWRGLPPEIQSADESNLLNSVLNDLNLPTPILQIPTSSVGAPWWLVFIGHEIGHHLQHGLGYVDSFAEGLADAAKRAAEAKKLNVDSSDWLRWGEEVFADACSMALMGPAALRALAEIAWCDNEALIKSETTYPSPLVRLALMHMVGTRLKWPMDGTLDIFLDLNAVNPEAAFQALAQNDEATLHALNIREDIAQFIFEPDSKHTESGLLAPLAEDVFLQHTRIQPESDKLVNKLTQGSAVMPSRGLAMPRVYVRSVWAAWVNISQAQTEAGQRKMQLDKLATQAENDILNCVPAAERGERDEAPIKAKGVGAQLVQNLLKLRSH